MPGPSRTRRAEGIVVRHARRCAAHRGASCDCRPGYQAQVFSQRDRKTIRKTFRTLSDARAWRAATHSALRSGTLRAPTRTTVEQAASEWRAAAKAQVVRTRSGSPYKPSALRGYEQALQTKIVPELGHLRLSFAHPRPRPEPRRQAGRPGKEPLDGQKCPPAAPSDLPAGALPLRGAGKPDPGVDATGRPSPP